MSDQPYDQPLVHLPGTKLTPEVLLHRTLNKVGRIKAVAVVILWDDEAGTYDCDWSLMKTGELVTMGACLSHEAGEAMFGGKSRYEGR